MMEAYNPKILRFLYELTKLDGFMSNKAIARSFAKNGWDVSSRTIDRWMYDLKKGFSYDPRSKNRKFKSFDIFNYFPTFFYEKLGLVQCHVLFSNPSIDGITKFRFSRYNDYATWLFDPGKNKSVLLLGYTLPIEVLSSFRSSLKELKRSRVVSSFEMFVLSKSFTFYSNWEKTVDSNGKFFSSKSDKEEISRQMFLFENHLKSLPKPSMIPEIRDNPLIVPLVFEQYRNGRSSSRVWEILKEKLSFKVENFFHSKKILSDGVAIKHIQKTMKQINNLGIFHQMRLSYMPFELSGNLFLYYWLEFDSVKNRRFVMKRIAENSFLTSVRNYSKEKYFFISLVPSSSLPILFELFEKIKIRKLLFLQHEKSLPLLTNAKLCSFDYRSCFDPKSGSWKS